MTVIPSQQDKVQKLDNGRYHGGQRDRSQVSIIVLHATAGDSAMSSINYLNREDSDHKASYHYLIERDGTIYRMLPIETVAYHAGDSAWPSPQRYPPGNGGHSINARSLGIAFANKQDGEVLTDEQMTSCLWLTRFWMDELSIPPSRVIRHKDCSPGRKSDPNNLSISEFRQMLTDTQIG